MKTVIQLFIPLTGLVCLLAYFFLSSDMRMAKRLCELDKMKEGEMQNRGGWEFNDLI
ncbi:MAG: hypothetical protein ACLQQ4_00955 [Bacteroidia bacterium]